VRARACLKGRNDAVILIQTRHDMTTSITHRTPLEKAIVDGFDPLFAGRVTIGGLHAMPRTAIRTDL